MKRPDAERVLVVGDAHFAPDQNMARAEALGNVILAERPQRVVLMGDWVSMDALSSFDKKGGTKLEGKRVKADVQSGIEALKLVTGPTRKWNAKRTKNKKACYKPRIDYIEGNHEHRIVRWWENDAQLYGTYALPEEFAPYIDSYTHYSDYLWVNEVGFTHVPFNKIGPISSSGFTTSIAQKAVTMSARSTVFGHTHLLDLGRTKRIGADETIYSLNVGCFFEPENDPEYMAGRIKEYWRGVVWMDIEPDGAFDFQTVTLDKLIARYT